MLSYEDGNSPMLMANKTFCTTVEDQLKAIGASYTGYCNSFGYDIIATYKKNGLTYGFKYQKHQTTQNGVVIPVNANVYAGVEVSVGGLNQKLNLRMGRSKLRRLFTSARLRKQLPDRYFLSSDFTPENELVDILVKQITISKVSGMKLRAGVLKLKAHQVAGNPVAYLDHLEQMISGWR